MSKFKLEFETDNGAFYNHDGDFLPEIEVSRILGEVRREVERGFNDGDVRDVNGNLVGTWKYT